MRLLLTSLLSLIAFISSGISTKVVRVIDGDTFEIETGEKVRLIGIDAPEISDIFGQEAKQYLIDIVENKVVDLQTDSISNDKDRYNRLLRYVIIEGIDINEKMVADGYAFAYLKYHFSKSVEYRRAQIQASENNQGIWGNGKNKITIDEQKKKGVFLWRELPPKTYVVGFLIFMLILLGLYSYVK